MSALYTAVKAELPYEWVEGKDVEITETADEIQVHPLSAHAVEHIGEGQYLGFSK